jgi:hypothetical protein
MIPLLLSLASAHAQMGQLTLDTRVPAQMQLDRGAWMSVPAYGGWSAHVSPGMHVVHLADAWGATLFHGRVVVQPGTAHTCTLTPRKLSCRASGPVAYAGAPPLAPARPLPPTYAAPPPTAVQLVVRSIDGEWADVLVDGLVVAEMRNQREAIVTLRPGRHTVEVREFLGRTPYTWAQVDTGYATVMTLGLAEDRPITFYDAGAYTVLRGG